jgi:hypothetical protein
MATDKIEKLKAQRATLEARIRREQGREKSRQRTADTRRKILAGAAALDEAEKDAAYKASLMGLLGRFLTRPDDRALFSLPVPPAK